MELLQAYSDGIGAVGGANFLTHTDYVNDAYVRSTTYSANGGLYFKVSLANGSSSVPAKNATGFVICVR